MRPRGWHMALASLLSCGGATAKGRDTPPAPDASVLTHADAAPSPDAALAPHADAPMCDSGCLFGATKCAPASPGVETCELQATGCTAWSPVVACGAHELCQGTDTPFGSSAICMCDPTTPCQAASAFCDGDAGLMLCAVDDHGCYYQAGTSPCPAPNICFYTGCDVGFSFAAVCLPVCSSSCGPDASMGAACTGMAPDAGCGCAGWSLCNLCGP